MVLNIPIKELIYFLRGYSSEIFEEKSNESDIRKCYFYPSQDEFIDDLINLSRKYSQILNLINKENNENCKYKRYFIKGIKEALILYEDEISNIEAELIDPALSLSTFFKLKRFYLVFDAILEVMNAKISITESLNQIYRNCSSPNPLIQKAFYKIYIFAIRPMFIDIWSWVAFGHVSNEPHHEFFIKDSDLGVKLIISKIPFFISQSLTHNIFFSGQVINKFCKTNLMMFREIYEANENELYLTYENIMENTPLDWIAIENLIEKMRKMCAKYTLKYIIEKENLFMFFKMIKDLVLTGNENFISAFMKSLFLNLQKKPLTSEKLKKALIRSLNYTLMDFFNEEKLEKISNYVKVNIEKIPDKDKWPKIMIEFNLPPMIQNIIKFEHFLGYNKIFNFCLQMYYSKQVLNDTWLKLIKQKQKRPIYWNLLHRLLLIIDHLYYFYKVNIIERLYFEMMEKIKESHDYEALIRIHHEFVIKLVHQSLLDIDAVEKNVSSLFAFCQKICRLMNEDMKLEDLNFYKEELAKLCSSLDYLFTNLKSYSIFPTLSHLVVQIHKCLINL